MAKDIKLWKKQEKRIVKLLYIKGFLDFKLNELYWAEYHRMKNGRKRKGKRCSKIRYAPEIHYCTVDYFGECDEYSVVDYVLQSLYWENAEKSPEDCDGDWPKSTFNYKGRKWFINYLKKLPTIKNDSKINKVLKFNYNY